MSQGFDGDDGDGDFHRRHGELYQYGDGLLANGAHHILNPRPVSFLKKQGSTIRLTDRRRDDGGTDFGVLSVVRGAIHERRCCAARPAVPCLFELGIHGAKHFDTRHFLPREEKPNGSAGPRPQGGTCDRPRGRQRQRL